MIVLLGVYSEASAQSATLRGFVTDRSDGQPLELVHVVVENEEGRSWGSTTNPDGLYVITGITAGRIDVRYSFVGYETYVETLVLERGEIRTHNISLIEGEAELDEVLVEYERQGGVARVTAGQQTIRPAEVDRVPSPDVTGDLVSYLTTLPGIVVTGDRGGQLFIRGGEPAQNLVLLDGILLYQPFHLLGFYSAFPSEVMSRADVYAGGFSSKYGGRLSSVIDVKAREGNKTAVDGSVSLSPFICTAQMEGPLLANRISMLVSVRQSLVEKGAATYMRKSMPFRFGDLFGKVHGVVTDNTRASATFIRTHDRGTLDQGTGDTPPEEMRYQNTAVGGRFLMLPKIIPVMVDLHLSYSHLNNEIGSKENPVRTATIGNTYLALEATYFGDRIDAEAGTTLRISSVKSELSGLYQNIETRDLRITNWGNYLVFDVDLGGGLHIHPGVRAQWYRVRFYPFFEPRVRVVWNTGVHQVSGALGIYRQEVVGLSDRRDATNVFTVWTGIPRTRQKQGTLGNGRPQRAIHTLLGYGVRPAPWLDLSVEGFYKTMSNLFIAEWTAFPRMTTRLQPASGRSIGFDIRLEVRRKSLYGYLTYGLSSTRYAAEQAAIPIWYGVEKLRFRPPHDRRHQVNALISTNIRNYEISLRWAFGSGFPFSRAIGFDGFALMEDIVKASDVPGFRRVIYEHPFSGLLPTYHRLDVAVSRVFRFDKVLFTVQGSVINVYDRPNLLYLDVFTLRRADQLPFIPSIGFKMDLL